METAQKRETDLDVLPRMQSHDGVLHVPDRLAQSCGINEEQVMSVAGAQ